MKMHLQTHVMTYDVASHYAEEHDLSLTSHQSSVVQQIQYAITN